MAEPSVAARSFDGEALPHLDTLYRVALRLTADPTLAEDLVQDTMLKAYRSWQQYRPGTNARGWLLTILRNTIQPCFMEGIGKARQIHHSYTSASAVRHKQTG